MKLVTFRQDDVVRLGALTPSGVVDLAEAGRRASSDAGQSLLSMQALIDAGDAGLDRARTLLEDPRDAVVETQAAELLSPLPLPVQMRDFVGFETHFRNAGRSIAYLRALDAGDSEAAEAIRKTNELPLVPVYRQQPIYYKCNRFATSGTGADVVFPASCVRPDYELELAAVIGKRGRDISSGDAREHIFGYTIFNDFTARDLQMTEMEGRMGPAKGKDFDGANVLGPCIVTADEIGDPYDLSMRAWVNDEIWSDGNTGSITWSFEQMIEHVSRDETLHAGEILGSGTVGFGCGLEHLRFLADGDVVTLEIESIGAIRNRIRAPAATGRD